MPNALFVTKAASLTALKFTFRMFELTDALTASNRRSSSASASSRRNFCRRSFRRGRRRRWEDACDKRKPKIEKPENIHIISRGLASAIGYRQSYRGTKRARASIVILRRTLAVAHANPKLQRGTPLFLADASR